MTPQTRSGRQSLVPIQFLLLSALWGLSFVAIQVGLREMPPLLFAALRYDIAGLVMLGFAASTTAHWRPRTRHEWLSIGIAGGLLIALHHALLYMGQQHVSGAVAAVVVSLVPVLTALFAAAVLPDERFDGPQYGGVLLGFTGVVAIVIPSSGPLILGSAIGVGLVFCSAAAFALGSVALRPLSTSLPLRSMQAWGMLLGAGLLHVVSGLRGEPLVIPRTAASLGSLAYLSLAAGVAAYVLYFNLLDRVGPSELNLVSYLQPVVATTVSWAFLEAVIDLSTVAGMVAIFFGFALVKRDVLVRFVARPDPDPGATDG